MSKQKGIKRYTDPASGRPVMEVTKEQLGAVLGKSSSRTATRAVSRWNQGAMNQGKGDMQRPQTPAQKREADISWLYAFCRFFRYGEPCICFECRHAQ